MIERNIMICYFISRLVFLNSNYFNHAYYMSCDLLELSIIITFSSSVLNKKLLVDEAGGIFEDADTRLGEI